MADTAVALTTTPMDSFTGIIGAATAISAGDTAVVAAAGTTDNLLIEVVNTTAAKTVTVVAGVGPRAELGDLVATFGAAERRHVAVESARFAQSDGTVRVTMEGAGTVRAIKLPAGA